MVGLLQTQGLRAWGTQTQKLYNKGVLSCPLVFVLFVTRGTDHNARSDGEKESNASDQFYSTLDFRPRSGVLP